MFREVDIDTGNVLFEWHASDHFAINETFYPLGSAGRTPYHPFDFFHINSIDKTGDGNYIISSRMLHSIVCVSSTSGMVLWVLGGRRNEFADVSRGTATHFRWQHHANVQRNGMISIFDNAKWMKWYTELWDHGEISRGMLLSLDTTNMTSELIQEYTNPGLRGSPQQGSMQVLEGSGNIMVGWGYTGAFTEFSREGKLLCDTHINPSIAFSYGLVHSYRAFRAPTWIGRPNTRPDIYMRAGADRAFVSWLGSTEVEYWLLQTAEDAPIRDLVFTNSTKAEKTGFESIVEVPKGGSKYMRIVAVGRHGQVFATSKIIRTDKGTALSSGQVFLVYAGVLLSCCLVLSLFLHRKLRSIFRAGKQGLSLTFWGSRGSDGLLGRRGATEIEYMPLHND